MKEKRTFKKLLSMFLSFVMVVSLITITDFLDGKNAIEDVHAASAPTDHTAQGGNPLPYEATELIESGDCSENLVNVNMIGDTTQANGMIKILSSGQDDYLQFYGLPCEKEHTYVVSYYIYVTDANNLSFTNFVAGSESWASPCGTAPTLTKNTDGWEKVEFKYTANKANTGNLILGFRNNNASGSATIYIDDIVMYEVNPEYLKLEWQSIDNNGNWVFKATGSKTRSKYYNFTKAIVDGTEYLDSAWLGFASEDLDTYGTSYIYTNGFAGEGKDPTSSLFIPKGTKLTGVSDTPWNTANKTENDFILENDIYVKKENGVWKETEYTESTPTGPSDHTPTLEGNSGLPAGKTNMIANGDCSENLVNVNMIGDTTQANGMIKILSSGQDDYLQFYGLPCEKEHTYVVSYYIYVTDANNLSFTNFVAGSESWASPCGTAPTLTKNTDGWEKVEFKYTANKANTGNLILGFRNNNASGSATIYIDDIVMYDTTLPTNETTLDLTYAGVPAVANKNQIQFTVSNNEMPGTIKSWSDADATVTINGKEVKTTMQAGGYTESSDVRYMTLYGNSIKDLLTSENMSIEAQTFTVTYNTETSIEKITFNIKEKITLERFGDEWVGYTSEYEYPNGNEIYYNIDNDTSYVITTTNNLVKVVKDGKEITAVCGTELNEVGEYEITKVESGVKYVQKVVLYKNGDADASGNVDICDLVSMKRESENKGCNLAYAADLNRNDKVDSVDLNAMRRALAMNNADTAFVQSKGNSILNGVMPIGGMTGPSYYSDNATKFVNSTIYKALADMGINNIGFNSNDFSDTKQGTIPHDNMKLAEENGIGIYVTDGNCIGSGSGSLKIASETEMLKFISEYSGYKSFLGMSIVDEPNTNSYQTSGTKKLSDYSPAISMFNKYTNIHGYVSMYPWVSGTNNDTYSSYMQEVSDAGAEILSYDNYPITLTENKNIFGTVKSYTKNAPKYDMFYNNLVVARQKSLESGKPFHTYAQVGVFRDTQYKKNLDQDTYGTTAAEIQWQVNASLAFGAKGIQYFPMVQSDAYAKGSSDTDNDGLSGLITASGKVNTNYSDAVTATNKFVATVDEVLMNSTSKGIVTNDTNAKSNSNSATLSSYNELNSVTGSNALVGCFDYYGKTALLVVNCNLTSSQDITLGFNKSCTGKITKFDTTTTNVSGKSLTLNVGEGQSALVVLE